MERWVHVDLKGGPPLVPSGFWENWCKYIQDKGQTKGLILEFEDVLPIQILDGLDKRREVYSREEVKTLLSVCHQQGLKIIPLVQTCGHLEFLLKYPQFAHLREVREYPDSIQPAETSNCKSLHVVCQILDQVLELFNDLKIPFEAVHLGGDEVWHLGQGDRSKQRLQTESKIDLFLTHMSLVAQHVRSKYPEKRMLMWDDMMRSEKESSLRSNQSKVLRENVEVVVWQYTADPGHFLPHDLFTKYSSVFSKPPWIATAYKGASSSCAFIPDLGHHVGNHLGWKVAIDSGLPFGKIEPAGIILTGWQRFDHYAALCELLPVSVPSLRCCFMALDRGKFTDEELQFCFQDLGLQNPQLEGNQPKFPGSELYVSMTKFVALRSAYHEFVRHDTLTTWINDWQIANRCVSRLQSEAILRSLRKILCDLNILRPNLNKSFDLHFRSSVKDEWFGTYFDPIYATLNRMVESITPAVDT